MSRPLFVTLDALDGVGKTTLVRNLAKRLGAHAMDTPGLELRKLREQILEGLGPDQLARCVFYASTVIAQGGRARALADRGGTVVMDRYWPSTLAYARARGVDASLDDLARLVPRPDVAILLTVDEEERKRRLDARAGSTAADRETLAPAFRERVLRELRSLTTVEVDITGADEDEAVERVIRAL